MAGKSRVSSLVVVVLIVCSASAADAFLLRRPFGAMALSNPLGSTFFDSVFDSLSAPHIGLPSAISNALSDDSFDAWDNAMNSMFDRWQVIRKCRDEEKQSLASAATVQVENKEGSYDVVASLPGVPNDQVEVHLNGEENSITIKAHKERKIDCRCGSGADQPAAAAAGGQEAAAKDKDKPKEECVEVRKESFSRTFTLPSNADLSKISAQWGEKDSALHITIPKSVPSRAKLPINIRRVESLPADDASTPKKGDL